MFAEGLPGRGNSEVTPGKKTEQFTRALLFALLPVIGLGTVHSYVTGLKPEE